MAAFSEKNPNVQLVWDASSLKNYQFCPRYYQMNNLEGWQTESVDLAFGRYMADGMELYQKERLNGATRDAALLAVTRWALNATYFEGKEIDDDDAEGYCIDCPVPREPDTQWGGHYEDLWKCDGLGKYKNARGNRAVCPFAHKNAWFPGDPPDICTECRSGIITDRQYIPDDKQKNRKSLLRALIWYALSQPEELDEGYRPYVFPDGTPAVELSGKMPLPFSSLDGEPYVLAWNLDYIGQWGSELFITDNKTTRKPLNAKLFKTYSPDTQFDTYSMVATIAYPGLNIRGVMLDGIQLMVDAVEFGRFPYYKTEAQHEEHLRDLQYWIKQAEQNARDGYWPMNKRNCWLCPLNEVCSQSPEAREGFLKSNFKKRPRWDSSQER